MEIRRTSERKMDKVALTAFFLRELFGKEGLMRIQQTAKSGSSLDYPGLSREAIYWGLSVKGPGRSFFLPLGTKEGGKALDLFPGQLMSVGLRLKKNMAPSVADPALQRSLNALADRVIEIADKGLHPTRDFRKNLFPYELYQTLEREFGQAAAIWVVREALKTAIRDSFRETVPPGGYLLPEGQEFVDEGTALLMQNMEDLEKGKGPGSETTPSPTPQLQKAEASGSTPEEVGGQPETQETTQTSLPDAVTAEIPKLARVKTALFQLNSDRIPTWLRKWLNWLGDVLSPDLVCRVDEEKVIALNSDPEKREMVAVAKVSYSFSVGKSTTSPKTTYAFLKVKLDEKNNVKGVYISFNGRDWGKIPLVDLAHLQGPTTRLHVLRLREGEEIPGVPAPDYYVPPGEGGLPGTEVPGTMLAGSEEGSNPLPIAETFLLADALGDFGSASA